MLLICVIAIVPASSMAYAQETGMEIQFTSNEQLAIVIVGILAGVTSAYQGFSKSGEEFSSRKFFDRVVTSSISSVALAVGAAATQTEVNIFMYVMVFLAAIGSTDLIIRQRARTHTPAEIEFSRRAKGAGSGEWGVKNTVNEIQARIAYLTKDLQDTKAEKESYLSKLTNPEFKTLMAAFFDREVARVSNQLAAEIAKRDRAIAEGLLWKSDFGIA